MESKCKNSNAADKELALSRFSEGRPIQEKFFLAVNYDKKTKVHQCLIEKYEKEGMRNDGIQQRIFNRTFSGHV